MNKIISYFPDTDLRCGHRGLSLIAKRAGKNVKKLGHGQFILFTNRKRTHLKLFAAGNALVHIKSENDHPLNMDVIKLIPKYFNGSNFNYKGALKEVITKSMAKRGIR